MCGTSEEQTDISSDQSDFYKELTKEYSTIFGQNQEIIGALTSSFLPILQAGPSQTGFSQGQENALRTQNVENVATDYAQAQRATANILAARGGGNTLLPSSVPGFERSGIDRAAHQSQQLRQLHHERRKLGL